MNSPVSSSKNKSFLTLENRSFLSLNAVTDIISFDESEVLLATAEGNLSIQGSGLHIKQLSLENGRVEVEGKIDLLEYNDKAGKEKGGLWRRRERLQ